jgi:AcrR family transcriptional regulator
MTVTSLTGGFTTISFILSTITYNLDDVKINCDNISVQLKKRKTNYHHGHLRDALVECGLELIEEKGIRALTMREIAKRLNVSRTAAYAHFKDKAALFAAIREAGYIEFRKVLEVAQRGAIGFAAQINAMSVAYFRFAQEHPAHFEVMFNALLEAFSGAAAESGPVFTMLTETVREAQQQGEVRPGDPALLARVVWALVHGASLLQRESVEPQFIRFSNEVLRSGLNDRHATSISPQSRE